MTVEGWLQIAIFVGVLTALTPPLGAYMARVYTGERVFLSRILGPLERGLYRLLRVDPGRGQDWKAYGRSTLLFSVLSFAALYLDPAHAGHPAVQPRGLRLGALGRHLQHHVVVRQQHQLAVLRRRDDAQLLRSDGRAHGPELRSPRRSGWRCSPRSSAASPVAGSRSSATSGRTSSGPCSTSCCRSPSSAP